MHKLTILAILLLVLDILLYKYLNVISLERKEYLFKIKDEALIYQIRDIKLNDINDFVFDNYFRIISFNNNGYKYEIDEDNIIVHLYPNRTYKFKYELIEPKVITETIVVEKPVEVEKPIYQDVEYEYYIESDYFYVDNEHFTFALDTDLDQIREVLKNNIHTSYETNIDYSQLNVSQVGQYNIFYSCENEKIEIIIEIV